MRMRFVRTIPERSEEDKSGRKPEEGEWPDTSVNAVPNLHLDAGPDPMFVHRLIVLVKGILEDCLVRFDGSAVALLHNDEDFYKSYLEALQQLCCIVVGKANMRASSMSDSVAVAGSCARQVFPGRRTQTAES